MNSEVHYKQERFQILLKQIDIPEEIIREYLNEGRIEKLGVNKSTKTWNFHFVLERVIPAEVFSLFSMKLVREFSHIAKVSFVINTRIEETSEMDVQEYWPFVLDRMGQVSPGLYDLLKSQAPKLDGRRLILSARNEAESELLKRNLTKDIISEYKKFGHPEYVIDIKVNQSQKAYEQFVEERQQEEQAKMMEVIKNQEKDEVSNVVQPVTFGYQIKDEPISIETIQEEERRVTIQGYIFDSELRELRSGRTLLTFKVTDYTDSIVVKIFSRGKEDVPVLERIKKGLWVKVRGGVQDDTFMRDLVINGQDVNEIKVQGRVDSANEEDKRVELHAHSRMSQMDAVLSVGSLVKQAADWGHKAVAITDHAVAQAFPEAYVAGKKNGIKVLYGIEANLVDDDVPIAYNPQKRKLDDSAFIVFDVETTGLSAVYNKIIELAAVKIVGGEIVDRFESFANPHQPLSDTTIELTGITDEMVQDAPEIEDVLSKFKDWIGDEILVAHNASFDMGFLNVGLQQYGLEVAENPVIDTLELSRFLYPQFGNHRLNTLCKKFNIELAQHHRAIYDAEATGYLLWKMMKDVFEKGIEFHDQLNGHIGKEDTWKRSRPSHCILLAKNNDGLKNLFKLISEAHTKYFYRVPRVPRSLLRKHRDGIIVGSGCDKGEVFEAMLQKSPEEVEEIAGFYDYLEVQPPSNYYHLVEKEFVDNEEKLKEILSKIVDLGVKLEKPVVATGNVHYMNPNDKIYRKIMIKSQGGNPLNRQSQPDVHFRTTDEMLECFSFLGEEKAKEIVVQNTQKVADSIEEVEVVKDKLFTPKIEGADEEIREMSYEKARSIYGEKLPEIVEKRIEKELKSIIGHGFSVIYLISAKLVKKSLVDGYLVGSRGSVGSSFVATMTEITEVNPLPPHYVCPECNHSQFFDDGSVGSGYDLPDKNCPQCGVAYMKDGQDIPFETFLGFKGDKVPDIDLNFSGEYQPVAHNYTKELFGEDNVYRAGTIGTVAQKTAYGYVKGYEGDLGLRYRGAEVDRLVEGCTGVKRTTGQHPGGIIVIPDYMDVYDFTPIQFPADDQGSEWKTTHFDFHSIHDNVLKLDILGHDDPTVIRMLQDLSGMDPKDIPTDDEEVMKIFSGPQPLGVTEEQIMCKTGTLGIPEFGTRFVRQMLEDTKPNTFSELVQISGLSHGTDVWLGNAQELINNKICELSDVIGCRDDIMVYLMHKGLDPSLAFKIMEFVRKGKGLQDEWVQTMKDYGVPDWYIDSCSKIRYMFPKAHAAAYVLMAVRIAYFKVHHPIFFYAAYFTVRAEDFDIGAMVKGSSSVRARIEEINEKGREASPKEKSLLTVLELALEMIERGYKFQKVDLYRSSASEFIVDGDTLIAPFNSIPGLGTNAAKGIEKAREEGEFLSKEDLRKRSKISKTVIEFLDQQGCLEGLPEENQLSLF
ncbi:PolC-type DNA polymerase III (plasmid) [Rossellomorea sp. AcN35-11]|nr:PolC-type DNA polymerase III [Rossellomorea aquimaris]WJV32093.1 PolC-type DNA polymerase III [Rossellomorea sp. AcN35-11]